MPIAEAAASAAPPATRTGCEIPHSARSAARTLPPGALPSTRPGIASGGQAGRGKHRRRPISRRLIQPERAGGVGDVGYRLAGQLQPEIVLRRKHLGNAGETLALMLPQPQQLRSGETRHGDDAGDARKVRNRLRQRLALPHGARVVPEDRRADRFAVPIHKHRRRASGPTGRSRATLPKASGRAVRSCATAARKAAHQSRGSCSDHPGRGRETASGTDASARIACDASTSTAFRAEVPRSIPRTFMRARRIVAARS